MSMASESKLTAAHESMAMVETVRSILKNKGNHVWSLSPEATVYDAIALMAEKGVGALLVLDRGKLAGIISERDYARKVILKGHASKEMQVQEIMTRSIVTVTAENTVAECMRIMTDHRVRHLPVFDAETLAGVISIGDVVRAIISAQADTIRQLSSYITGEYPA
jgi:CBS domain-containing protein